MLRAGAAWWVLAFGAWAAFSVLVGWAWPRFIAPLFNRFRELEAGDLRDAVESLARRCGFEPRGVYVMDGSRRSTHGNAYFTGLGRNKRIVFFDTLLAALATAELQAVLAHELGHYRLRHVAVRLAASLGAALAGFALLAWLGAPAVVPARARRHRRRPAHAAAAVHAGRARVPVRRCGRSPPCSRAATSSPPTAMRPNTPMRARSRTPS